MSLKTNLISYWKLDEASGNAIDARGINELTAEGLPGSASGKVANCRTFNGTNQSFSRASNASVQVADIDFTVAGWINIANKDVPRTIAAKWNSGAANSREFFLDYDSTLDRFRFTVSPNNSSAAIAVANAFGSPSSNTWIFVIGWHDSVANTINVQVNNGTVDSLSHATGVFAGTADFTIGLINFAGIVRRMLGQLDEVGFWKRTLTADERTQLYNSGNGLSYDAFGGSGIVPIIRQHYAAQGAR